MTENTLNQTEMAAALGLSQSQVSKDLRAADIISGPAGGYSLRDLVALAEYRVLDRIGMADGGQTFNVEGERGRLLARQSELAELKIAEARADLVSMTTVAGYWADIGSTCRSRLASVGSRLAATVPDPVLRVKVATACDALVFGALEEIQKDCVPAEIRARVERQQVAP